MVIFEYANHADVTRNSVILPAHWKSGTHNSQQPCGLWRTNRQTGCTAAALFLIVFLFGGVSKAGEIRTLPKTSLPVAVLVAMLRAAKGVGERTDPSSAWSSIVFHIALLGGWCIHTVIK
jgi:hypothetical protein